MTVSRVGIIARATNGQRDSNGNFYDCEVLRTLDGALMACVTLRGSFRSWMSVWEPGEWDGTEHDLARSCARNPLERGGNWTREDSPEWDTIAERWDAAREEQYERRMEGTGEEE